ncbi:MAG TPA: four helix bundle protein [Candidatus Sulfotelmatobacter sp.]|nr:four helix bundle protein [Candidatus Sulfotelmatobacter sp.]
MAQHFKDLIVWQKAMDLVTNVYGLTDTFPKREVYSLTDQIRRAAVSIPSNIAEGQAHFSKAEFVHFLRHAMGSLAELETQLLIAERLQYAQRETIQPCVKQIVEVGKLLNGLINSLKK